MEVEAQLAGMGLGGMVMGDGTGLAGLEAGSAEKMGFASSKIKPGDVEPMDAGAAGVKTFGAQ